MSVHVYVFWFSFVCVRFTNWPQKTQILFRKKNQKEERDCSLRLGRNIKGNIRRMGSDCLPRPLKCLRDLVCTQTCAEQLSTD